MKPLKPIAIIVLAFGYTVAHADVLELKNGSVLNGKYVGGTAGTVRFEALGSMQVIATGDIIALTFTTPAAATPKAAAATSATLPSGTMLLVRMMDSVSSKNKPGATFTTKLEYNLVVNQQVVVKAGTLIYGKVQAAEQAGRAFGRSTMDLRLTSLALAGNPQPISTSSYKEAGEASIKKAAGGAAIGAAIGAIADGGDGAGKGAAIGATASLLKRGQAVTVPPGTLLEFALTQPVTVQVAN